MTLVKGPNGIVVDVASTVASGLIGGGYVVAVDSKDSGHTPDQTTDVTAEDEEETAPAKPAGNASKGDWEAYALSQGFGEEQLDGLKQREIRDLLDE
ncbi:hypothetical protein 4C_0007 [Brevibacterium phage 4C]|uniref:Uncharacterized protein n=31 Tax=Agmunavirus AGM1 TaxID=2843882 RepID=A0A7D0GHQ7_9CAUD|nr:hypothetical protein KMC77_gp07 [Brevibacterium phage AGM1]QDH85650.1 hypothetical protein AGM2_0007 [Brevibacterium phage AGM2]QDH85703.1 hypothetical protein AGM3_0007 [Brevibacterium phage AGM3]QDH85756.1 hypothetical protein AGM4_0007 [Brevibacterium phage AGM4]QDH85809.1 hypothetical protein AGM5_0007 [Brevibacterium phage AGM5]QDH85862.1 hypothetical protein AGM6_0007 [Brevibacterium phage AGM6]QDH85915.1 hypothetical protein AGM7_0007 [Brevibacterium phage AGM7]QDH85968.1 hypotheti